VHVTTADRSPQTITVKIPPGIDTGEKLRVKGKGHPGGDGGPAGDIILTVQIGRHPYFQREGLDLLVDVPVTIAEATFGATVSVPLLKGSNRRLSCRGSDRGREGPLAAGPGVAAGTRSGVEKPPEIGTMGR
jgi:molecular chaperone DnaJ